MKARFFHSAGTGIRLSDIDLFFPGSFGLSSGTMVL
jgi:hypothetical protein